MKELNHLILFAQSSDEPNLIAVLITWVIIILSIVGGWKTFAKAGEPGWAILVPIYNVIVVLKIAGKPIWWIILFIVPLVNIIIAIVVSISMAQKFGKGVLMGLGLAFVPFIAYPALGFGSAQYRG